MWSLAAAVLVGGCTARRAMPRPSEVPAAEPSVADSLTKAEDIRAALRELDKREASVARLRDPITGSRGAAGELAGAAVAGEIAREIAANVAEWEADRRELASAPWTRESAPQIGSDEQDERGPDSVAVRESVRAVERKYAPAYLNCRIRIKLLAARVANASGPAREILVAKLEEAEAELAATDEACRAESDAILLENQHAASGSRKLPSAAENAGIEFGAESKVGDADVPVGDAAPAVAGWAPSRCDRKPLDASRRPAAAVQIPQGHGQHVGQR